MTIREAIRYINTHPDEVFKRDGSGKGWICPFCGSGGGPDGTGMTIKPESPPEKPLFRCWACEDVGEVGADGTIHAISIIDILAKKHNIDPHNTKAALAAACSEFGIAYDELELDDDYKKRSRTSGTKSQKASSPSTSQKTSAPPAAAPTSTAKQDASGTSSKAQQKKAEPPLYTQEQFNAMHDAILADNYLADRGIGKETISRHPIGLDVNYWTQDSEGHPAKWKAVVFALGAHSAEYRNTDTNAGQKDRYRKKGAAKLWNLDAIRDGEPVFVTEGIIDALSLEEVGGPCIGLSSASNVDMLLAELRARAADKTGRRGPLPSAVIDVLDNDDAGRAAALKLRNGIKDVGGMLYIDGRDAMFGCKDPNDALLIDRTTFAQQVAATKNKPREMYVAANSAGGALDGLRKAIQSTAVFSTTGFSDLDELLGGGLFAGSLYFIGAISSLGKTTFCLELADNVAKSGVDVLYFSLEMSKHEIMSKSLSRLTHRNPRNGKDGKDYSKTTRGIMTGSFYQNYSQEEKDVIQEAFDEYAAHIGKHMFIFDGLGTIGTDTITKAIQTHKRMTGRTPLVVIDYIQILKDADERATDKKNVDINVVALKTLAVNENLPIIGISSFNRDNYRTSVNLASFKESGAIEYSSDVLIGLQYFGMDEPKRNKDGSESGKAESEEAGKARRQELINRWNKEKEKGIKAIVPIELKVLKDRNGKLGKQLFYYWPATNDVKEVSQMFGENEVERDDELTPDEDAAAVSFLDRLNNVKIGQPRSEATQEKRRFDVFYTPTLTSLEVASMRKDYKDFCERHPHGEELVAEWAKKNKIKDLAKMTGGQYKDLLTYFEKIDALAIMYGKEDDTTDADAPKMQTLLESARDVRNQKELDDLFDGAATETDKGKASSYTSPPPPPQPLPPPPPDEFF